MAKKNPENLVELLELLKENGVPKDQYKDRIDRFLDMKAREHRIPMRGQFELTPLCNFDCMMCYVHLLPSQMNGRKLLSTGQWKDIMAQAVQAGMTRANLTGGECLTYPGFRELYLYLQDLGVRVSINTNGALLTDEIIELLKTYPPERIQITLYGSTNGTYEKVTGSRAFDLVYSNAMKLKEASLPLEFAVTPSTYMDDAAETVEKALRTGINTEINSYLLEPNFDTGRSVEGKNLGLDEYIACYLKKFEILGKTAMPVSCEDLPEPGGDGKTEMKGISCGAGRSAFQVDWKGVMHACVNAQEMKADILSLGFAEAWKRVVHMADDYRAPVECEGCEYRALCVSCPVIHKESGREGHCNSMICSRTKRMVQEGIFVLERQ